MNIKDILFGEQHFVVDIGVKSKLEISEHVEKSVMVSIKNA